MNDVIKLLSKYLILKKHQIPHFLSGLLFVALFATAAIQIASFHIFQRLAISPLIIGIVMGMLYSATLHNHLNKTWIIGIDFSAKKILRIAIILYGFRVTFQDIVSVGLKGFLISLMMIILTMVVGMIIAKLLKIEKYQALLITIGSAVCGAAAVLALEAVLKSKPYKSSLAVATVIIFGTLSMFLYPFIYDWMHIPSQMYALYVGGSIHEVAQVIGASSISKDIMNMAVVVKMTRVILLVPTLILIGIMVPPENSNTVHATNNQQNLLSRVKNLIPWFAVIFMVVIAFHSLHFLPIFVVSYINSIDTFLLTMTMTAIGMQTNFQKIIKAGFKPIFLGVLLWIWLIFAGYGIVHIIYYM